MWLTACQIRLKMKSRKHDGNNTKKILNFLNKGLLEAFFYIFFCGLLKPQYDSMRNESVSLIPWKLEFLGFIY